MIDRDGFAERDKVAHKPARFLAMAVIILGVCFALRLLDVFVIRSDEWFGEQVLTKAVGLAIILTFAMRSGLGLSGLGFRRVSPSVLLGVGIAYTAAAMLITLFVHWGVLSLLGQSPRMSFAVGGIGPGAMIAVTNIINGLMEESLFRGLLLFQLVAVVSRFRANLIQAMLFGIWHFVWPLRAAVDGDMTPSGALIYGTGYVLISIIIGLVWGWLILWFRSLWVTVLSHALHNAALTVVQVGTATADSTVAMFTTIEVFIFLALLPLLRRFRLEETVESVGSSASVLDLRPRGGL